MLLIIDDLPNDEVVESIFLRSTLISCESRETKLYQSKLGNGNEEATMGIK
jgi:hypothetical protein